MTIYRCVGCRHEFVIDDAVHVGDLPPRAAAVLARVQREDNMAAAAPDDLLMTDGYPHCPRCGKVGVPIEEWDEIHTANVQDTPAG